MEQLIFLIIITFILLLFYKRNLIIKKNDNLIKEKSQLDGETYKVLNKSDSMKTANILSKIKKNFTIIINELNTNIKKYPKKEYAIKNLVNRTKNLEITERPDDSDDYVTSYTLNKGELMVVCLRSKFLREIHDFNIIFYVCIHELAHIASNNIGHDEEFESNFKFLLKEAIRLNLYIPVDYRKTPVDYCGIKVDEYLLD